jgi:hypothetical protein
MKASVARNFLTGLLALLITSCATPSSQKDIAATTKGLLTRQDLEIVDCLLPGQVRQLGTLTYLTQRRPVHTTASDCRLRGGEYVAYDRANLKTALVVWLAAAQAGDAEAQNNVGELYERGLGDEPNYEAAIIWYQKAADQGNSRALFNLGTLYEQGLGVPADKLKALNLYRQSWGLPEDNVIFRSAAAQEQNALRSELQKQLTEKDSRLALLQTQLKQTQAQLTKQAATARANAAGSKDPQVDALNKQVESLKQWIAGLEAERRVSTDRLAEVARLRTPGGGTTSPISSTLSVAQARQALGLDFGRFYALVIGNQHYQSIESLQTPIGDVQRAAKVLANKYGFTVQVLEDANDVTMLKALNDLNGILKPEDNVLIYYAGHGTRLQTGKTESGYWLPVNADAPPQDTYWVPNEQITAHLGRLPAKRVLVVADSCYAGLLSTDPSFLFLDNTGFTLDYIKYKLPKRSRLLFSSGGDQPVLDTGGGRNSVFAEAFLDELESNQGVMAAPDLFTRVSKRVASAAARNKFVQKPEFKSIKGAGHEVGDFFFVPKS